MNKGGSRKMKGRLAKKQVEALRQQLVRKPRLVWDVLGARERKKAFDFAERYKGFLDAAKTEREAVHAIERFAAGQGFRDISEATKGKKFYKINKNKKKA